MWLVLALSLFAGDSTGTATVSSEKLLEVVLVTVAASSAVDFTCLAAVMREEVNAPDAVAKFKEAVSVAYRESGVWPGATITRVESIAANISAERCLLPYIGLISDLLLLPGMLAALIALVEEGVGESSPLYVTAAEGTCRVAAVAISSACWSSGAREPDGPRLTPASTTVDENETT